MKTVMILSNAYRPDPRVEREARILTEHNIEVHVICWDRTREYLKFEISNGINIHRLHTIPSTYGAGIKQILLFPKFWKTAKYEALQLNPEIIHCHDLDTLSVGIQVKKIINCPIIFDAHEDYPALMSLYLPKIFFLMLKYYEKRLVYSADHIITASTELAKKYQSRFMLPITTIGNYPSLNPYQNITDIDIKKTREDLGFFTNDLVVAYIGGFSRNRQITPLIDAIKEMPEVKLLLCGDGYQRQAIETSIENIHNINYRGWISAKQVPLYTSLADIVYYCLDVNYPGAVYNAPNTLANAMAAGRPVIANQVGDLGRIVAEANCGVLLDQVNSSEIKKSIYRLKDPNLRQKLGQNGKKAAEQKYNSSTVDELLFNIYSKINP